MLSYAFFGTIPVTVLEICNAKVFETINKINFGIICEKFVISVPSFFKIIAFIFDVLI